MLDALHLGVGGLVGLGARVTAIVEFALVTDEPGAELCRKHPNQLSESRAGVLERVPGTETGSAGTPVECRLPGTIGMIEELSRARIVEFDAVSKFYLSFDQPDVVCFGKGLFPLGQRDWDSPPVRMVALDVDCVPHAAIIPSRAG